ncbi:hypothetical protein EC970010_1353B, partial [Escherichia coli 97.0010]
HILKLLFRLSAFYIKLPGCLLMKFVFRKPVI